jgi:hypothetical protein
MAPIGDDGIWLEGLEGQANDDKLVPLVLTPAERPN